MPLDIPETSAEVELRAKTDVRKIVIGSNPFLKNSWVGALVTAFSNRIFDFYIQLKQAIKTSFPDTSEGDFLLRWAAIYGLQILPASISSGNVTATGVVASNIVIGTILSSSDGKLYDVTATVAITNQVINVLSITRVGNVATVQTVSAHNLGSNVAMTILGAVEVEYNVVDAGITVISLDEFTFEVLGTPTTPATGTITADFDMASIPIQSQAFGLGQDQPSGTNLKLQSPIIGVDDTLTVDFNRIGGGADQESSESLRTRMLERIQNPLAHFNTADISNKAREIAGVTRVFVQEITPAVGQVTILFMRDNDSNPIPAGSEITDVKNKILEISPANTADSDVIVVAPVAVAVAFTFTSLTPNTVTMQAAISANLQQLFAEDTDVAVNVTEDAYRSTIFNTIDLETGQQVSTFVLSVPSGDVVIASGEIAILGTVTYP